MISGIVTGILLMAFLGITAWAWSARRREDFEVAARLPLDDEGALAARSSKEERP